MSNKQFTIWQDLTAAVFITCVLLAVRHYNAPVALDPGLGCITDTECEAQHGQR